MANRQRSNRKTDYPRMSSQELELFLDKFNFTNEQFADLIAVTPNAIRNWLLCQRKIPPTTVKLVRMFDRMPSLIGEFK